MPGCAITRGGAQTHRWGRRLWASHSVEETDVAVFSKYTPPCGLRPPCGLAPPLLVEPFRATLHISLTPFSQGQLDIMIVRILGIGPSSSPTRRQGRRSVSPIFQPVTALTPTPKNPFLPSHFFSGQLCGLDPDSSWQCATVILSMLWNLDVVGRMVSPPNPCPLKTLECGPCLEIGSPQMQLRIEMR